MRFSRSSTFVVGLAIAMAVFTVPAMAQTHGLEQRQVPHYLSSGAHDNATSQPAVVFSTIVQAADVPWLRLSFQHATLGHGSHLRLTSLADGGTQHLHATHLHQWENTSAYFNGGAVLVELVAGAGTRDQLVEIGDLWVGMAPTVPYTQCGPTDDREPSNFPERARLLSIGCTAWMYNADSCFASAGHCISNPNGLGVVQFNVPPSNPNGSLNHPGPEDQYPVDRNQRVFTNGGQGNDWGLFKVFENTETGLLPFEVQGAFLTIADSTPAVNETISVVGYGVDGGERNQTQQTHSGPVTLSNTNSMRYQADTQGGNSGSGVVYEATGEAVAIHTHGGCNTSGTGSNAGTSVTHPNFQAALASFCQDFEISIAGTCPGPVTVTVTGAPPNSEVALVSAANNNGWTKTGTLCPGVSFEIGEPFQLPPTFVLVDGSGNGSGNMTLQSGMCWVEALAFDDCETTGANLVP